MFHSAEVPATRHSVPLRTRVRQEPDSAARTLGRSHDGMFGSEVSDGDAATATEVRASGREPGAAATRRAHNAESSRPSSQEMCFACFDALLSHLHGDRTHPPAPAYVNHLWCVRALLSLLPARLASRPPAS